ncbi:hypothetical protein M9H77_28970 [Catharanthus roseus]|uniref:Uncharacterized protein n=1 Tax=Catharanthus roseus TaxID=4058 RepID=A0ACC0AGU5_CATRO|nr:hypothetical protein M9H77_28970 [Catharanthus roseus]
MAEIGISVAAKVAECLVAPIGRQFVYLFFFNNNLENLRDQYSDARRNVEAIRPDVEEWLSKVKITKLQSERIFEENGKIGTSCFRGWCLHTRSGYSLSRRAKKLGEVALHLQGRVKFNRVEDPIPITCLPTISSGDFKTFESRNFVMKEIMESLRMWRGWYWQNYSGERCCTNKAKDEHMFDEIV